MKTRISILFLAFLTLGFTARAQNTSATYDQFRSIKDGMTLPQVNSIFGFKGTEGKTDSEGTEYNWPSEHGPATIKFHAGRVMPDIPDAPEDSTSFSQNLAPRATPTASVPVERTQCTGVTKKGEQCKRKAVAGTEFCKLHTAGYVRPNTTAPKKATGKRTSAQENRQAIWAKEQARIEAEYGKDSPEAKQHDGE